MRRTLAILKYFPAVLCGLLVVVWVVSIFYEPGVVMPSVISKNQVDVGFFFSSARIVANVPDKPGLYLRPHRSKIQPMSVRAWAGMYLWRRYDDLTHLMVPIPFLMTILLPLSIAPFTRFPLWSYFAWTALIAAELAYYLR